MSVAAQNIVERYEKFHGRDGNWRNIWQDQRDHILPSRLHIDEFSFTDGQDRNDKMFDSTATDAATTLANSLQSSITNKATSWFRLAVDNADFVPNAETKAWLKETSEVILKALNRSNFHSSSGEMYKDLPTFGTACTFMGQANNDKEGFRGFSFKSIPMGMFVIAQNDQGVVNECYRTFDFTGDQIRSQFGESVLTGKMLEMMHGDITRKFKIIHGVRPRKNHKQISPLDNDILAKDMAWESIYVEQQTKTVMEEGGFHEFPYLVPRWSTNGDELYGRGPGDVAMPDIISISRLTEYELMGTGLAVLPPVLLSDEGVVDVPDLTPGGRTYVDEVGSIAYLESKSNFSASQLKHENLVKSIQRIFLVDALIEILGGRQAKTPLSATEITERLSKHAEILGPAFGNIEVEYLNPLIERAFNIMWRMNALPEPPAQILELAAQLSIKYLSPLALAQRNQRINSIMNTIQDLGVIAQIDESVRKEFDGSEAYREVTEIRGTENLRRDPEIVAEINDAEQQQAQQAQQIEQQTQGLKAAGGGKGVAELAALADQQEAEAPPEAVAV